MEWEWQLICGRRQGCDMEINRLRPGLFKVGGLAVTMMLSQS
jgi:hypothetical protein